LIMSGQNSGIAGQNQMAPQTGNGSGQFFPLGNGGVPQNSGNFQQNRGGYVGGYQSNSNNGGIPQQNNQSQQYQQHPQNQQNQRYQQYPQNPQSQNVDTFQRNNGGNKQPQNLGPYPQSGGGARQVSATRDVRDVQHDATVLSNQAELKSTLLDIKTVVDQVVSAQDLNQSLKQKNAQMEIDAQKEREDHRAELNTARGKIQTGEEEKAKALASVDRLKKEQMENDLRIKVLEGNLAECKQQSSAQQVELLRLHNTVRIGESELLGMRGTISRLQRQADDRGRFGDGKGGKGRNGGYGGGRGGNGGRGGKGGKGGYKSKVCFEHNKGTCTRGDDCRYNHSTPGAKRHKGGDSSSSSSSRSSSSSSGSNSHDDNTSGGDRRGRDKDRDSGSRGRGGGDGRSRRADRQSGSRGSSTSSRSGGARDSRSGGARASRENRKDEDNAEIKAAKTPEPKRDDSGSGSGSGGSGGDISDVASGSKRQPIGLELLTAATEVVEVEKEEEEEIEPAALPGSDDEDVVE
jgi:hypothetical protein